MAKKRRRPPVFSATKAVKANARERLGTPPPTAVIADKETKRRHRPPKHKPSLQDVIAAGRQHEEV